LALRILHPLALLKGELAPFDIEYPDDSRIFPRFIMPLASGYKLTFQLRAVQQKDENTLADWPPFPFFLLRIAA